MRRSPAPAGRCRALDLLPHIQRDAPSMASPWPLDGNSGSSINPSRSQRCRAERVRALPSRLAQHPEHPARRQPRRGMTREKERGRAHAALRQAAVEDMPEGRAHQRQHDATSITVQPRFLEHEVSPAPRSLRPPPTSPCTQSWLRLERPVHPAPVRKAGVHPAEAGAAAAVDAGLVQRVEVHGAEGHDHVAVSVRAVNAGGRTADCCLAHQARRATQTRNRF